MLKFGVILFKKLILNDLVKSGNSYITNQRCVVSPGASSANSSEQEIEYKILNTFKKPIDNLMDVHQTKAGSSI